MGFFLKRSRKSIDNVVLGVNSPKIDLVLENWVFDEEPLHVELSCTVLTRFLGHEQLRVDVICQDHNGISGAR